MIMIVIYSYLILIPIEVVWVNSTIVLMLKCVHCNVISILTVVNMRIRRIMRNENEGVL
ncbi:hypothetical protein NC653_006765 [Populus alba x Populus x berolinensis]|uniref:Uncharacterized protein n=1 Tax=Populus alba x Populus x berolinensis TaxID=444605 RepID=A0AAD6RFB9_9ROSI|nr:hypothetical protein NC653_006765 [Populus alba x Populus x berolinensis]